MSWRGRDESRTGGTTRAVAPPQIPSEFSLEGSAGQHIQIGIDGFMRNAHRGIVRILLRQAVRNLFRRPAVREQVQEGGAQARVGHERSRLAPPMRPALGALMGLTEHIILATATIELEISCCSLRLER